MVTRFLGRCPWITWVCGGSGWFLFLRGSRLRSFTKANGFMVSIYPTFICKVPRDWFGFGFSLDGFKIEFFEFVEIQIVFFIIRDSDLLLGVSEIPGEFSSEGINFLSLPLGVDSFVNEGVVGVEMIDGDVMLFFFCEGSSLWFPTHSLMVSW